MAAGLTGRVWSLRNILKYRAPPEPPCQVVRRLEPLRMKNSGRESASQLAMRPEGGDHIRLETHAGAAGPVRQSPDALAARGLYMTAHFSRYDPAVAMR